MTRTPSPPEDLSRDESRYLDGVLPVEAARRLERQLAADPVRAGRLEAWREAMDVWRDDAAHAADAPGAHEALVERVLAASGSAGPASVRRPSRAGAGWYAAAAVLLIGIGCAGTFVTRSTATASAGSPPRLAGIEEAVMDQMINSPEFSPSLANPKEGR